MRRTLLRIAGASVAGLVFVLGLVWYASLHDHIPEHWPRVYLASDCPASDFAMAVAEGPGRAVSLVTIPLDDGALSIRACRLTLDRLAVDSVVWWPATKLPDSLVCGMLVIDGSRWMARNQHARWPVFVGADGRAYLGADVEGLRTVGLEVSDEEYARMLERLAGLAEGSTRRDEE
ncbi:hypothetical protein [Paraliomyxa miuraensis]|uniref:hypothetical protein n=1 Tax=Paraliomyxa miuraensis TaxID=376150 RepID=UPI0022514CB0|nr:hypothetical protein [Paraliomyxa miuraensis]MCX4243919.1 hypothetical protein [Paraliomyxa miuraensis]